MSSLSQTPFFISLAMAAGWLIYSYFLIEALRHMPKLQKDAKPQKLDLVSIVVPAKNEEKNIRICIESLLAQDYSNFEIIVINDNSTDGTQAILENVGASLVGARSGQAQGLPLHVLNCPPTPEGWTGKNFAIHTGMKHARGQWLLFTDADTRHEKNSVSAALAHMQSRKLEFLTLLPRCLAGSFLEYLIQPAAMCLLGLWFPVRAINDPESPIYFANGQFLMMSRRLYELSGGHEAVRGEFLEDFALCKKAKELKARAECTLGESIYGTRMYDSFSGIWRGWRRIYLHSFQSRPLPLALRALSVLFLSSGPFILFLILLARGETFSPAGLISGSVVLLILIISWHGYQIIRARRRFAFLHGLAALFVSLILADATWMAITRKKTVWK